MEEPRSQRKERLQMRIFKLLWILRGHSNLLYYIGAIRRIGHSQQRISGRSGGCDQFDGDFFVSVLDMELTT